MDEKVEQRLVAFVRMLAGKCANCLRRDQTNCRMCICGDAQALMRDVNASEKPQAPVDYSLYARMKKILEVLETAGRPLMAKDINISDICSYQLKNWTINKMVSLGMIGKKFAYRAKTRKRIKEYYYYYIQKKDSEK